jgi:hypothetical protein
MIKKIFKIKAKQKIFQRKIIYLNIIFTIILNL